MKQKKPKKTIKQRLKEHKLLIIILSAVVLAILIASGTKIFLYINFLLGNDILTKLDVDKESLSLTHGQQEDIEFTASITTNPFCRAECSYNFMDISSNKTLDKDMFTIRPVSPFQKTYTIKSRSIGTGLDMYRFEMSCRSQRTLLCHTSEKPVSRSILVTIQNNLTEQEEELKNRLKQDLNLLISDLGKLKGKKLFLEKAFNKLNKTLIISSIRNSIDEINLTENINKLKAIEKDWNDQNYNSVAPKIKSRQSQTQKQKQDIEILEKQILNLINEYNTMINNLKNTREQLTSLSSQVFTNSTLANQLNSLIKTFNQKEDMFKLRTTLNDKNILINTSSINLKKPVLKNQLSTDISYDAVCIVNNTCISHPTIEQRANQTKFNMNESCRYIEEFRNLYISLDSPEINQSVKDDLINKYQSDLPENKTNTELIKELLQNISFVPQSCNIINFTHEEIEPADIDKIQINNSIHVPLNIEFKEPVPQCCVFGNCSDCCVTSECRNNPKNFPVIFLHGHAISKETSAQYSLEGFNKIQDHLEKDSYISAGTITLYSSTDDRYWDLINEPLSLRTSYYFDIFKEPENYVVVQTKSESINTYALRLGEIIDNIKQITGRPKVKIIAFSMGGLVARKYLQIHGTEDTSRLIMIGTPNKGISGDIARLCPVTGEGLECRDMNKDSLFINKLNRYSTPDIPIHNIVGSGCDMDGKDGDGAVLKQNALLDGVNNYIINGTCRGATQPLHLDLRDIDKYPKVYKIIKNALD